jgi:branched-chain amino acid transport system permease protein
MPAVSTAQFPFTESVWYLAIVVIGGFGGIAGVFLGSIIVRSLGFLINESLIPLAIDWAMPGGMLFGVLPTDIANRAGGAFPFILAVMLILFLIFAPAGVIKWWEKLKMFYRCWPFSY